MPLEARQGDRHSHERATYPLPLSGLDGLASDEELEKAAAFFRAAGDPGRLQLLERLGAGEACVSDLADVLGVGTSTLSQRLRVLRDVGLVQRRREGKQVYYTLSDQHVHSIIRAALDHAQEP